MEVKKIPNERNGFDIHLVTEENELQIVYMGNLDLYWMLKKKTGDIENEDPTTQALYNTFFIGKENLTIYYLFEKLYNDIITGEIFKLSDYEREMYSDEELAYKEQQMAEANEFYKYQRDYLVEENKIKWHSDEHMFEIANVVVISKQEEGFLLEFLYPIKGREDAMYHIPGNIPIRFRNSGSTYDPYQMPFMEMYQKLQDYDEEKEKELQERLDDEKKYHQITIAEYLLSLKKRY